MKISVDGGGLGAKKGERFGNYIFSQNLIQALAEFDKKNQYCFYTFDKIKPFFAWSKIQLSLQELKEKKDIFLALNQAIPLYVSGKIISFCHGLSYYYHPEQYTQKDKLRLNDQLKNMMTRSDYIIASSIKVKKELLFIDKRLNKKIIVIPFGVPFDMLSKDRLKKTNKQKYFLFVGMDHSIKNIKFIIKAFRKLKKIEEFKEYKLIVVTKNCSRKKLKQLYQGATALLTASFYESFNLPVLEALSQGCPIIGLRSAVIPEFQSYVNIANNKEEFIKLMKKPVIKPDSDLINKIINNFNWNNYVNKLVKLYK